MSFKIARFTPIVDIVSVYKYFQEMFGKLSGSDMLPIFIKDLGGIDLSTTTIININYGTNIDYKTIKKVSVKIIDDNGIAYEACSVKNGLDYISWDSTQIVIAITVGGFFNTTDFNDPSINRGEVIIWI